MITLIRTSIAVGLNFVCDDLGILLICKIPGNEIFNGKNTLTDMFQKEIMPFFIKFNKIISKMACGDLTDEQMVFLNPTGALNDYNI